jgi:rubrerythrin
MRKAFVLLLVCVIGLIMVSESNASPYPETEKNLMAAVTGETQANANYLAFADKADKERRKEIARIFRALADAEIKHASDEFEILKGLNSSAQKPTPNEPTTGTTKQNLQEAIDGETFEYTIMYPGFITAAETESMTAARRIFNFARQAEEVHARIYTDIFNNYNKFDRVKYEQVYRCPVCGNIIVTNATNCPICGVKAEDLIEYKIVDNNDFGCNAGFFAIVFGAIPFVLMRRK